MKKKRLGKRHEARSVVLVQIARHCSGLEVFPEPMAGWSGGWAEPQGPCRIAKHAVPKSSQFQTVE